MSSTGRMCLLDSLSASDAQLNVIFFVSIALNLIAVPLLSFSHNLTCFG